MTLNFALFDTKIGVCGIAWGARGIAGVRLPEASAQMTRARLRQRFPEAQEAPSNAAAKRAIEGIILLLRGERINLSDLPLDMSAVPPFHRRVYDAARKVEQGKTTTYGLPDRSRRKARPARSVRRSRAIPLRSLFPATG
jgi:methylated-DNA-[protein]-cysteine S-methyltransferase